MIGRQPHLLAVLAAWVTAAACVSPPDSTGADRDAGQTPVDDAAGDPEPDAAVGLADLSINVGRARIDLAVRSAEFAADSCELDPDEACVAAPGMRRLLHFAVETPNLGDADLVLGEPDPGNPVFQYSECHDHYHFEGYAAYRLIDRERGEVAVGRKQAFCLLDTERYVTDDPSVAESPRYRCSSQGIQRGWSDVYHAALPCQFIDITDVPDGAYTLEIELNSNRTLPEKDYDNNLTAIPIELGSPDLTTPTELCPDGIDDHASSGTHRECGWELAGTFECEPGLPAHVGCSSSSSCGGTACAGNPMIRVCDGAVDGGSCSFAAALHSSDDTGGGECPCSLGVPCPESGQLSVYAAPSAVGQAFECDVQVTY